jgi:AcrR family transcriptional regulator
MVMADTAEHRVSTRGAATRERLIDATVQALAEGGIRATTTKEIARRAGVTEPTLYLHFASKDDLMRDTLRERLALPSLVAEVPEDADKRPVADVLAELLRSLLAAHRKLLPTLGAALSEPTVLAYMHDQPMREGRMDGVTRVRDWLASEQSAGRIGSRTPAAALTRLLFSAAFHHAVLSALFDESRLEPAGDAFVAIMVDALLAAAGPGRS